MRTDLHGAVAAVTGGARGIGLAIAEAMSAKGALVVLGDLDTELAEERAAALGGLGCHLDVRDEESFTVFLRTAFEQRQRLDVLVNSAGVIFPGRFLETSAAQHEAQFAVNFEGTLRGMRLALPYMVDRACGHIINISSAAGRIPAPNSAVYTASKHAITGLSAAVRGELAGTGVRLTAVLPTAARTEMSAGLRLRGIPTTEPQTVASAVVRTLSRRRPPAVVMVPRWLSIASVLDLASPLWLSDAARRLISVREAPDSRPRAPYEQRLTRQFGTLAPRAGTPAESLLAQQERDE